MTTRSFIFSLLMVLLTVAPVGMAWACGQDSRPVSVRNEAKRKSCCHKADNSAASPQAHSHASKGCPCDHANGGCHCPGCGLVCHAAGAFTVEMALALIPPRSSVSLQSRAFYFAEHRPEAVYLPIWQPPKLSA